MIVPIFIPALFFFALDFCLPWTLLLHFGAFFGSGRHEIGKFRRHYGVFAWPRTAALILFAVLCGVSSDYSGTVPALFIPALLSGAAWIFLLVRDFVRAARRT